MAEKCLAVHQCDPVLIRIFTQFLLETSGGEQDVSHVLRDRCRLAAFHQGVEGSEPDGISAEFAFACQGEYGAGRIAEELGIPKSSVHTIIDLLLEDGLVGYGNRGASVTDLGRAVLRAVPIIPLELDTGLALGECRQAVRIPDRADQITSGIPQVKLSNIVGAVGCTTWVVENGRLVMPPHKYYEYENHRELERLVAEGNLEEGDVFLVCGADSRRAARAAALFVALDLF